MKYFNNELMKRNLIEKNEVAIKGEVHVPLEKLRHLLNGCSFQILEFEANEHGGLNISKAKLLSAGPNE